MSNEISVIETKIRNLTYIVLVGFIVILLLLIGLYFKDNSSIAKESSGTTTTDNGYDVSKMNTLSGEEATKLFDKKGTHVLYIGRSTCGVCVNLVPQLNAAMEELDIKINYLPLESTFRTDFGKLFDLLDIETEINGEEGTYGELLETYGYTPLVIVIKDGKMVDGFVGSRDSKVIVELIEKYI